MRSIVAAGAILFAASVSSAQTRSADEAAIHAQTAAYESAINQRDPAAVAALFAPDGDLVFFDSPRVSGRDAIIQNTKDALATWPATMRFTLSITAIRFLTPDAAIVDTEAHFSEGDMRANRGTSVVVRQKGKWLIAALRVFPAQRL